MFAYSLCRGGGEKLEVISLISWNTPRQQNGIILSIVPQESHHMLCDTEWKSIVWQTSAISVLPLCYSICKVCCLQVLESLYAYGYNNVFQILVLCACSCFGVYLCHVACERCSHRCCILCDESILWCLFDLFPFLSVLH